MTKISLSFCRNLHHFFLFSTLLLAIPLSSHAQYSSEESERYLGNTRYMDISASLGLWKIRDFATSPLIYSGPSMRVGVSLSKRSTNVDASTNFMGQTGLLISNYNEHTATSRAGAFSVSHSRLYRILKKTPERWNFKVGGEVNFTGDFRVNPSLMNAAVGIEAFPVLFGSIQVVRDITRKTPKRGREPKKKSLSFRLSPGLFGCSVRNGYSYLGIAETVNESGFSAVMDGYKFEPFGVSVIKTSLDYTIWLKSRNGWRFSYDWEAYKTRKDYSTFESASHTFKVALLFNNKNI